MEPAPGKRPIRPLILALEGIGLALIALVVVTAAARNVPLQMDFDSYLAAARAALAGLDPYSLGSLAAVGSRPAYQPWVYPPVALLPFLPLAALPDAAAAALWMGVKVTALAGLVALWCARFAGGAGVLAIALVAVFGWNAAAIADLRAGNVAILEAALLWSGFAFWAAGRRAAFAALVVAASLFKLTPAVFLALLLVPDRRGRPSWTVLAAAVVALAAIVATPLVVGPAAAWSGFLANVPDATRLRAANPSGLGFLAIGLELRGVTNPAVATSLWLGGVLALLAISAPALKDAWRERDPLRWIGIAVTLEILIAPRPMEYGFARVGPALFLIAPARLRGRLGALMLAAILCAQGVLRTASLQSSSLLAIYSPFLLTLAVWLWRASERRAPRAEPDSREEAPARAAA